MVYNKNMNKTIPQLIDLSSKTAIVTGGSKGIGLGIVRRLHEAGANIMLADIDEESGHKVCNELSSKRQSSAYFQKTDVSKAHEVKALIKKSQEVFGKINIIVNNAGIFPFLPLSNLSEEDFDRIIAINLKGVYLCCKYASEAMKAQGDGGRIITITSIDALHPSMAGLATYDASKHGVWGFLKNIALELAEFNISVNAIAPGGIATPGVSEMNGGKDPDPSVIRKIPFKRLGDPDEIGTVALFLASDMSSYLTGSQIVVDGGLLLS